MIPVDLSDPDNFAEQIPYEFFAYLRREDPVYWQDESDGPGFWSFTKYEDVKMVSRTPSVFSSWAGGTNLFDLDEDSLTEVRLLMLNMDPPQHAQFRRLVSSGFTPKRIEMLQAHVSDLARSIVDGVSARGECDFVNEIAAQLPMATICEMIGVPTPDRQYINDLTNSLIGFDDPDYQSVAEDEQRDAATQMYMYAERLADERRKCPMDDLATILLNAEVDGETLSSGEFDSFFLLLAIAGNETTRTVTSQGMRLLMQHPDQLRALRDDLSLLPGAVEEMLRYRPAVMHFRRTAVEDIEVRGKRIKKGDKVAVWYPSANRDEDVFPDGERFDITRDRNEHLAFGVGEHYCLGASLARLQLNTIFREILTRIPDMEFAGEVRYLRSNFIDGIKEMPVKFTPESK